MRSCILLAALAAGVAAAGAEDGDIAMAAAGAAAEDGGIATTDAGWETTTDAGWETTTTTVDPSTCPQGWIDALEGCYLFHYTEATTWASAQFECEKLGAFLAEPKTEEQVSLLMSLAVLEQELVGVEAWWIGLTDQSHEGRWLWAHSASDVTFTAWAPGSPTTGLNAADCVIMAAGGGFNWQDTSCNDRRANPICERETLTPTTTTTDPTTTSSLPQPCFQYAILNSFTRNVNTPGHYRPDGVCNGGYCNDLEEGTPSSDPHPDWRGGGWYRLEGPAGSRIPDSPPGAEKCGTKLTGWLSGGHPAVMEGEVNRVVMFQSNDDTHFAQADVRVVNCNSYFVYYLVDLPLAPHGYCGI